MPERAMTISSLFNEITSALYNNTFLILFIRYIVISFLFNLDPCFVFFFVIFLKKKEKKFATPFDVLFEFFEKTAPLKN